MTDVQDLPGNVLPAPYHVHQFPVTNNDCYSTGQHFNMKPVNYYMPTYKAICNPGSPTPCENRDLASKYGNITATSFRSGPHYDPDLTLYGPNSIIGKGVVIHDPADRRITCGNIVQG